MSIFTPTNQIRLTNVAVVRLKRSGKRFEIACYKNKVMSWRKGAEKDIDEVLQTHTIFANVSRGQASNRDDLVKAFKTVDEDEICKIILANGELQVSDKERNNELESVAKEVASIIVDKCVDRDTKRPYTIGVIERALKDIRFVISPNRGAKQQALEAITKLQDHMPLERAQMRISVFLPKRDAKILKEKLKAELGTIEEEDWTSAGLQLTCLIFPGAYRVIDEMLSATTKGLGKVEVLDVKLGIEGVVHV